MTAHGIEQERRDFMRERPDLYAYIAEREGYKALDSAGDRISGYHEAANIVWGLAGTLRAKYEARQEAVNPMPTEDDLTCPTCGEKGWQDWIEVDMGDQFLTRTPGIKHCPNEAREDHHQAVGKASLPVTPTPLRDCLSGILGGVVSRGFDGPEGLSVDDALDYAITLAQRVEAVMQYIADTGCTCPGDFHYASLPDHETGCLAQIEHLLTTFEKGRSAP